MYVSAWSRVYEREVRSACDAAKAALANAPPEKADDLLDQVSRFRYTPFLYAISFENAMGFGKISVELLFLDI